MNQFTDKNSFSIYVENMVQKTSETYVDIILDYCEKNYIEPQEIVQLLSPPLLAKVSKEFVDRNFIKKQTAEINFYD